MDKPLHPLDTERISLGRSTTAELVYPDDNGLSRQHLALEREGESDSWVLARPRKQERNHAERRSNHRTTLKSGDRIAAGHLILIYDGASSQGFEPVVVFDHREETTENQPPLRDRDHRLEGVIRSDGGEGEAETSPLRTSPRSMRAGNEFAGNRPCPNSSVLFSIWRSRPSKRIGRLMTVEDDELVVRPIKARGFVSPLRFATACSTAAFRFWCGTLPSTRRSAIAAALSNKTSEP